MQQISPPLLTSEPVLTEAVYFLREDQLDVDPLFQLLERGVLDVAFTVSAHWSRMRTLMARYSRMDLADASIVVMSELHTRCQVLTVDPLRRASPALTKTLTEISGARYHQSVPGFGGNQRDC